MKSLFRRLEGTVERPHFSAQIEDAKNAAVSAVLSALGWQSRIQPYASYGSTRRIRILARVLYAPASTGADFHDQPVHDMRSLAKRGFRNFTSQNDPGARVEIVVPTGEGQHLAVVHADRSGLVDTVIDVHMSPGVHEVVLRTQPGNEVTAEVYVFDERTQKVGIVSDIDDTVMVTLLPRPLIAAWNAFIINQGSRRIVPGMPVLYQQLVRELGKQRMPVMYLSTGAWNVSPFLQRFLYKNGYPQGPLLLTDWGPTNTGFFRSGQQHKERSLDMLRHMFPNIRWILIGDDGQHDPQIYSAFVVRHPDAVHTVAIRELTSDQQDLAHGATRPLRSVGAASRAIIGVIPRVWRRARGSSGDVVHPASRGQRGARAHSPTVNSMPSPAAAATGVRWISGPDGFALIRALRTAGVLRRR